MTHLEAIRPRTDGFHDIDISPEEIEARFHAAKAHLRQLRARFPDALTDWPTRREAPRLRLKLHSGSGR